MSHEDGPGATGARVAAAAALAEQAPGVQQPVDAHREPAPQLPAPAPATSAGDRNVGTAAQDSRPTAALGESCDELEAAGSQLSHSRAQSYTNDSSIGRWSLRGGTNGGDSRLEGSRSRAVAAVLRGLFVGAAGATAPAPDADEESAAPRCRICLLRCGGRRTAAPPPQREVVTW